MKSGDIIEYNMKNISPEKFMHKMRWRNYSHSFKVRSNKICWNFWNQKEVCELSPSLIFCMIFEEKYFSRFILLIDQI